MSLILNLESSTEVCSVSIAENGKMIDFIESHEGQNHAKKLSVFTNELLQRNQLNFSQIRAIAVSEGPGSYTGLRIGVSLAKGICYANQIPLIAVSPLQAMSHHVSSNADSFALKKTANLLFCPMIDARRMEVYTALYNFRNKEVEPVKAKVIDGESYKDLLEKQAIVFFGNGALKCQPSIDHCNATFIDNIRTSAQFMCSLSQEAYENNDFVDVAYFEPFYLKDFIAGKPKKNILKR